MEVPWCLKDTAADLSKNTVKGLKTSNALNSVVYVKRAWCNLELCACVVQKQLNTHQWAELLHNISVHDKSISQTTLSEWIYTLSGALQIHCMVPS